MIMCNDTLTLFFAEYKQGVTTYRKATLYKSFINTNKAQLHTKLGVDSKYNAKIVLTDISLFMPAKAWKLSDEVIKDTFWSCMVSDKDFICVGEVMEEITTDAEARTIKDKYECYSVKGCDIKRDFNGRMQRIELLGV